MKSIFTVWVIHSDYNFTNVTYLLALKIQDLEPGIPMMSEGPDNLNFAWDS